MATAAERVRDRFRPDGTVRTRRRNPFSNSLHDDLTELLADYARMCRLAGELANQVHAGEAAKGILNLAPDHMEVLRRALNLYGVKHLELRNLSGHAGQKAEHDRLIAVAVELAAMVKGATEAERRASPAYNARATAKQEQLH